ncbi:MAG TPA: Holliday junction branch migration protein RuvA [Solirubrobacteraceae bacterium]|nr:Holliday junction branch migration protein RuvA [Solirubrobacteraceae bacterium]
MIALIRGQVVVRRPDHVIVDCGGVGYRLSVSAETLRHVPATGNEVSLHAHLVVRDDALALYGFSSESERDLFLMLLGVQTVGPKMAIAVLSGAPPRELLAAVAAGDVSRLRAPGVGKRTAERIIAELREKVADSTAADAISVMRVPDDDPRAQAREALAGLGYGAEEIESLLSGADGASTEELISHALRSARR